MQFELAGWHLRLVCAPEALAETAAARYAPFIGTGNGPLDMAIEVNVLRGNMPAAHLSHLQAALLVPAGAGYRLDADGITAIILPEQGRATLTLATTEPLSGLEYFLRITSALLAFRDGGLLVHAAGLLVEGRAHLFTGVSGSGKSTVTALSPHATALSDDLVLLRPNRTGWTAHGTPFWNPETAARAGQTAHGPVVGIYKLVKAPGVRVEALSSATAAAELAANCPVVNGRPELLPKLLARCRDLAHAVPVRRLHFRKDASFWEVVEGGPHFRRVDDAASASK